MRLFPLNYEQKQEDFDKQDLEIGKFVLRLALANGAAYAENYTKSKADVEERNKKLSELLEFSYGPRHTPAFEVWKELVMLEYNCTTNDGHYRISDLDQETLRQVEHILAWSMHDELERTAQQILVRVRD
jgi:hypothetical protein